MRERGWPFVGRTAELRRVVEALTGATHSVVIRGQAGIGKSALMREAVRELSNRFQVVSVHGSESITDLAFGAFLPLMPTEVAVTVPLTALVASVHAWFARMCSAAPTLLTLDDVHHLDGLSAQLVHGAVNTGRCAVVATLREGSEPPDLLTQLWRTDLVDVFRLGPMDQTSVAEFAAAVLGGPADAEVGYRLWHWSQGNILLVGERIRTSVRDRALAVQSGVWRWTRDDPLVSSVTDLIDQRISTLPQDVRAVVELVALAEPVAREVLVKLGGAEALREATASGLVRAQGHALRIDHPVHAEAIVHLMDPMDQHSHVVRLAANSPASRPDEVLRLCRWHVNHGVAVDVATLTTGARLAYASRDLRLATPAARAAVEAGAGFDALEVLAIGLGFGADPTAALSLLDAVRDKLTTDSEKVRWHIANALVAYNSLHSLDVIDDVLAAAEAIGSPEGDVLHVLAASLSIGGGDFTDSTWRKLRSYAHDGAATLQAQLFAQAMVIAVAAARGERDVPERLLRAHHNAARYFNEWPVLQVVAGFATWTTVYVSGRTKGIDLTADDIAIRDFSIIDAQLLMLRAVVARLRGDLNGAAATATAACALVGDNSFALSASAEQAHTAALLGDRAAAEAAIARCDRLYEPTMALQYPIVELARLRCAAVFGDPADAADRARALAVRLRTDGFLGYEVLAVHETARVGAVEPGDVDRATELAELIPEPLPLAITRHVRGVLAGDADLLGAARTRFHQLDLPILAVEAGLRQCAHLRGERRPAAGQLAAELADELLRLDLCWLPSMAQGSEPLTPRQRQLGTLLNSADTIPTIAERMGLQVKTAHNHLNEVYRRLGAASRNDVAGLLALDDVLATLHRPV